MSKRNKVLEVIYRAIDSVNSQQEKNQKLNKDPNAVLFGKNGKLDSLGLINLIVAIEQNIEDEFETSITLADEKAMSQEHSPFRNVGSMVDYIEILLEEMVNDW